MRELGGSLGDMGTLLPLTIGYLAVCGMNPVGLLVTVGLAQSVLLLYVGLGLLAAGSAAVMPSLSALVSRYSPADRQGMAMGIFRSMGSLARALGPILGGMVYWKLGNQVPYPLAAAVIVVPLLIARGLPQPTE